MLVYRDFTSTVTKMLPGFVSVWRFKGTFRKNQMQGKVYIVIPIEKQILSALRNRFPFLDRTSHRQDMEKNILSDFSLNNLLFLCFLYVCI